MHTRRTLALERDSWDLSLDGVGRIVTHEGDEATGQNVANEARLFMRDAYFIQERGIPHFSVELGKRLRGSIVRSYLRRAALKVPDVAEVLEVSITEFDPHTRSVSGNIQFTTVEGSNNGASTTYF